MILSLLIYTYGVLFDIVTTFAVNKIPGIEEKNLLYILFFDNELGLFLLYKFIASFIILYIFMNIGIKYEELEKTIITLIGIMGFGYIILGINNLILYYKFI